MSTKYEKYEKFNKRKMIIAGNWKMNLADCYVVDYIDELVSKTKNINDVTIILGVPFTELQVAGAYAEDLENIYIAAQNVYPKESGAYTGEISPTILKENRVSHVIIGHSERREYFGESNEFINEKIKAVLKHNIYPILCVGEKLHEREKGIEKEVLKRQLVEGLRGIDKKDAPKIIVAYEPVWAIGTGKTATPEIAQKTHHYIREVLEEIFGLDMANLMTIQYGGSMKPENAKELLAQKDIDGGLIGGAALKVSSFIEIVKAGAEK